MSKLVAALSFSYLGVTILTGCGSANLENSKLEEAWNPSNDPANLGAMQNSRIDYRQIPTQARLSEAKAPWGSYYWSIQRGGISYRFQTIPNGSRYQDFLYDFPSETQVQSLSADEIARLSPAEKFDIAMDRPQLPLARNERSMVLGSVENGQIPEWWGLCHGWSNASYSEPRPGRQVSVTNRSGQSVVFYSDDLKALLSKAYGEQSAPVENALFVGQRCNESLRYDPQGRVINSPCRDSNPGAFHVVITEYLATRGESLVADLDSGEEVWNYPLVAYSYSTANEREVSPSDPFASVRAPNAKYLVDVTLALEYTVDQGSPSTALSPDGRSSNTYQYTLELDEQYRIVGGEWMPSTNARPDFLWRMRARPSQSGVSYLDLQKVRELIRDSNND